MIQPVRFPLLFGSRVNKVSLFSDHGSHGTWHKGACNNPFRPYQFEWPSIKVMATVAVGKSAKSEPLTFYRYYDHYSYETWNKGTLQFGFSGHARFCDLHPSSWPLGLMENHEIHWHFLIHFGHYSHESCHSGSLWQKLQCMQASVTFTQGHRSW